MTYITSHIMGGLGNQLFQIYTTIAYSLKNNIPFYFLNNNETSGITKRSTYWNSFLQSLHFSLQHSNPESVILREKAFEYNELSPIKNKNILLVGYFQSYKYFYEYYDKICSMISFNEQKSVLQKKISINLHNYVSIHFRIGDYINIQDCHPLLSYTYYEKSIQYLLSKTNSNILSFICFFEKKDTKQVSEIIRLLKKKFPECVFHTIHEIHDDLQDYEELLAMSMCRHNIIANSTFSWWGAYFN